MLVDQAKTWASTTSWHLGSKRGPFLTASMEDGGFRRSGHKALKPVEANHYSGADPRLADA